MLKIKKLKAIGAASTHLLALASLINGFRPATVVVSADSKTDATERLNMASLKSIESSWLQVPGICKAKGFNAEPIIIQSEALRSDVSALYKNLQA